ncbi:MAG TPA: Gfo/Idh/MocA family oxidoreductase, partial [Bacteroidales bacterium]|nr:Gfo/Idh/MocA family oxidoreductase [Bacteroidales bacterium]
RDMIAACEKNNVRLSIGYRLHFEPYTQEIMRLGQQKIFGDVLHVSAGAAFRNSGFNHWKWQKSMGGGAMMDMGVYPLQAARYVTGEEPVSATAQTFITRPDKITGDADEVTTFQLEFPGGAIASLATGFHASFNYLHASAEKGWFELEPFSGYGGIKGRTSKGELHFPNINQQAAQMDEVAECILNDIPLRVTGDEGLKDMIVVDAIHKSMITGQKISL